MTDDKQQQRKDVECEGVGSWFYSEEVKEHFFNPKNLQQDDPKPEDFDGFGQVGSPACGDVMSIWIKVDPETKKILDCKWRTFGCASAIASTSMLSVMATENGGLSLDEAKKIRPQDVIERLCGLPNRKIHCSVLGQQALSAAVDDYLSK